jgi:CubicO group peptidase (beta-lactamase class C family)
MLIVSISTSIRRALCACALLLALHPNLALAKDAERVGLDPERLPRIAAAMQGYIDRGEIAGAVTLVERRGRVAWLEAQGVKDLATREPMEQDTLFRIYSMSKPITSVATLMLYEEGKLRLTDPISRWIPELSKPMLLRDPVGPVDRVQPSPREITVRDLLTHCSGLAYPFTAAPPLAKAYQDAGINGTTLGFTPDEWAARLGKLPLAFSPGTRWNYSVSTDVLGLLVERVSGMPFADFLRARIFEPLEMPDTAFFVPAEKLARFATNYQPDASGKLAVFDAPATSTYRTPPAFPSGGGGLVSTAADYGKFAALLRNGGELGGTRLLSRKSVELMTSRHLSESEHAGFGLGGQPVFTGFSFGLGVMVSESVAESTSLGSVGRHGWAGAAGTWYWVDPKEEIVAVMLIQRMPSGQPIPISRDFETAVYQAIAD